MQSSKITPDFGEYRFNINPENYFIDQGLNKIKQNDIKKNREKQLKKFFDRINPVVEERFDLERISTLALQNHIVDFIQLLMEMRKKNFILLLSSVDVGD